MSGCVQIFVRIYFMSMNMCLHVCLCTMRMPGSLGCPELQMAVSCRLVAGNWTQVVCKNSKYLWALSDLSTLTKTFFEIVGLFFWTSTFLPPPYQFLKPEFAICYMSREGLPNSTLYKLCISVGIFCVGHELCSPWPSLLSFPRAQWIQRSHAALSNS